MKYSECIGRNKAFEQCAIETKDGDATLIESESTGSNEITLRCQRGTVIAINTHVSVRLQQTAARTITLDAEATFCDKDFPTLKWLSIGTSGAAEKESREDARYEKDAG